MATYATGWHAHKWTALASIAVLASLYGIVWYLMGGCELTPAPRKGNGDRPDPTLRNIDARRDRNVIELSLHIAWFHILNNRLPETADEVGKAIHVRGWPATPTKTTKGEPIAYRATGDKAYVLSLPGKDNTPGTDDDLVMAMKVPDDLPRNLEPETMRTWWDFHSIRTMTEELRKSLTGRKSGAPKPP